MKEQRRKVAGAWEKAAHSVKSWMTKFAGSKASQTSIAGSKASQTNIAGSKASQTSKESAKQTLEGEGKRLLAMLKALIAQNQLSTGPQVAVAVPEASVEAPPASQQQKKKLLFSAADLQGVSLQQKKKKKETENEAALQQQKSSGKKTGRPFSALDLSSVRLKGTKSVTKHAGAHNGPPPPKQAGAGPTPLHEQLKRALQSKFFKVRATPSATANAAAPEQDDVDEWQ